MKKILYSISVILVLVFSACSTDVDIYADYKDITIVYGLLQTGVDTNFVKITKAYLGPGNALLFAQNPDSSNYGAKLNVRLSGKKNGVNVLDVSLDTITIHNKLAGDSIFYYPDQLMYYTTASLDPNAVYTLEIEKINGDVISAETKMVQNFGITYPANRINVASTVPLEIRWASAVNGRRYESLVIFHYKELRPDSPDTLFKVIEWNMGTQKSDNLDGGQTMVMTYYGEDFYKLLNNNLENILNVKRWAGNVEVVISCGGEELSTYIDVNAPSNSIVQEIPEYTNLDNGYGIFSSRSIITKQYLLSVPSEVKLVEQYDWGFILNR